MQSHLDQFPSERGLSDSRTVDRSLYRAASEVLATLPHHWVGLGGAREERNASIRRETTMQERLAAWRGLCALPDVLSNGADARGRRTPLPVS